MLDSARRCHHQAMPIIWIPLTLSCNPSLSASRLDCIQCLHKADKCKWPFTRLSLVDVYYNKSNILCQLAVLLFQPLNWILILWIFYLIKKWWNSFKFWLVRKCSFSVKIFSCFIFLLKYSTVLDAFPKVIKVTNLTWWWDAKSAWYSLSTTCWIWPYGLKHGL